MRRLRDAVRRNDQTKWRYVAWQIIIGPLHLAHWLHVSRYIGAAFLGSVRRLRDPVRSNYQDMALCFVANHNAPLHLAQMVQLMLVQHHALQVRKPQTPLTLLRASFYCLLP